MTGPFFAGFPPLGAGAPVRAISRKPIAAGLPNGVEVTPGGPAWTRPQQD